MSNLMRILSEQYVIYPDKVDSLRKYIHNKFPEAHDNEIVLKDALERFLSKSLIPIEDKLNSIVRDQLVNQVVLNPSEGLTNESLFKKTVEVSYNHTGYMTMQVMESISDWIEENQRDYLLENDLATLDNVINDYVNEVVTIIEEEQKKLYNQRELNKLVLYEQLARVKTSCIKSFAAEERKLEERKLEERKLEERKLEELKPNEIDHSFNEILAENEPEPLSKNDLALLIRKYMTEQFNKMRDPNNIFYRVLKSLVRSGFKITLNTISIIKSETGKHVRIMVNRLSILTKAIERFDYLSAIQSIKKNILNVKFGYLYMSTLVLMSMMINNTLSYERHPELQPQFLEPIRTEYDIVNEFKPHTWEQAIDEHKSLKLIHDNYWMVEKEDYNPFPFTELNWSELRRYLRSYNSILAESPYFEVIIDVGMDKNLDPRLLFAITGQEQSFVRKGSTNDIRIANNPFNVYTSWKAYNTEIQDSTEIAANTVLNVMKRTPSDMHPIRALNKVYAEDERWWIGVDYFYNEMLEMNMGRQ